MESQPPPFLTQKQNIIAHTHTELLLHTHTTHTCAHIHTQTHTHAHMHTPASKESVCVCVCVCVCVPACVCVRVQITHIQGVPRCWGALSNICAGLGCKGGWQRECCLPLKCDTTAPTPALLINHLFCNPSCVHELREVMF